jgi:hypothetical protein
VNIIRGLQTRATENTKEITMKMTTLKVARESTKAKAPLVAGLCSYIISVRK